MSLVSDIDVEKNCLFSVFFNIKLKLLIIFIFSQFHKHIFWSNRSQLFFKIGALKNLAIFWIKKRLQHMCFSVRIVNIVKFLKEQLFYLQNISGGSFYIFLKVIKQLLCYLVMTSYYDVLIIFSSQHFRHIVWCIKSWTRLSINLLSTVKFSK